jgi:hypothetical protein
MLNSFQIFSERISELFFNGGLPNTFYRIMSKPQPYLVQDDHVAHAKHRVANFLS